MSDISNVNKSLSQLSVNERQIKTSFDRFGDDLTELILSFLNIEDKFRLQCINRRVKNLIFNKQNKLLITSDPDLSHDKKFYAFSTNILLKLNLYKYKLNYNLLENVLQKLQFLNVFEISGFVVIEEQLLRVIADNCQHLIHLWFRNAIQRTIDLSVDSVISFGQKCGQNLRSLRFQTSDENIRQLIKFTPNLVSFKLLNIEPILSEDNARILPKLKEISIKTGKHNQILRFQTQYSEVIQKLSLNLSVDSKVISGFSAFRRLQSLDLVVTDIHYSDFTAIDRGLRQMASNCHKLTELLIRLNINCEDNYNFMQTIGTFTALKILEVRITKTSVNMTPEEKDCDYGTIEDLKRLKQLKRLTLHLNYLSDTDFESIEQYLPQLESIFIDTNNTISDQSLQYMSRLSELTSIVLLFTDQSEINEHKVSDRGIQCIVNNCLHSQCLILSNKCTDIQMTAITARSIEAFKVKAIENPKIKYYFEFYSDDNRLRAIELSRAMKCLPINLTVKIDWCKYENVIVNKRNAKCIIA